jgi:hypothetical protein
MAEAKEVLKYLKLSVDVEQDPGEEIRQHIRNTLLGTPGKLRYRHTSLETKLPFLGRIYFIVLRKSEKLLGSIAFSLRETILPEKSHDIWYTRYFMIHAPLRDSTFKRERIKRSNKKGQKRISRGDSLLKNFIQPYFDDPEKYLNGMEKENQQSLVYAFVERDNLRSWNFTEVVGFETVGRVRTMIFSRYNPKKHSNVTPITAEEKGPHLDRLKKFYRGHTFYTEQNLFYRDNYFVCRENGEIVAGCQANPELWEVVDYPGGISRFLIKFGIYLPFFRRYIEPGYQKFMAVEGLWYKEGYENCIYDLFETAMAQQGLHSLLIWLDERCPLINTFSELGRMGIIGKFFKPALVDLRVIFNNYREEERQVYYDRPAYISCFDMT